MAREKPLEGHKLKYMTYGVSANCECGWQSSMWLGKGARGEAYKEWNWHKEKCAKAAKEGV